MADGPNLPEVATLVHCHGGELYRYAYRLCGSAADAEDLTQQTFLVAQQKLDQLRDATKARGWLFAVLRSCYLKLRRRPRPVPAGDLELDVNSIVDDLPERPLVDEEALQAALNELADEFKTVLLMFYFEGYSYKQIAAELELPIGTVMSRLSRGKRHLRHRLFGPVSSAAADRPSIRSSNADFH